MNEVLRVAAFLLAGVCGCSCALLLARRFRSNSLKHKTWERFGLLQEESGEGENASANRRLLMWCEKVSRQERSHGFRPSKWGQRLFGKSAKRWVETTGRKAGFPGITPAGLVESQVRLGFALGALGLVVGYLFSFSPVLLGIAGFALGLRLPVIAGKAACKQRSSQLEQELPEMLSIVSMGLRSGLSFDQSFVLYPQHFESDFSKECAGAYHRWSMGVASREESLRQLGSVYDSRLLDQSIESMIRALRFGTSLAENFDTAAREARVMYRARCEEAIAKAPVKMFIPTGALILPAMLLLVLGPVLLEMMNGF